MLMYVPVATEATPATRLAGPRAALTPERLAWAALGAMLAVAAVFLLHETRDTTFWSDEWAWFQDRRETDLAVFLEPHNEHLSLVPVAIYKLLFAVAGTEDYLPYRLPVIAMHLVVATLVFLYARRRVGPIPSVLAAALILFLGPAWQNVLWGFQVAWLISLAAGVGALLTLDRRDLPGDAAAAVLLGVSLASSGLGLPIALGLAVDVLWGRRRLAAAWIVAAPLALYGLWWLAYQDSEFLRHAIVLTPTFMASAFAGALSSLVGLSGQEVPADGASLDWGRPLAVAAVALAAARLLALRAVSPRVLALVTILLAFWLSTGVRRSFVSAPDASRYLYVGGLFIVLLAIELSRGIRLQPLGLALLAVAVGAAVLSNVGIFREAGRFIRLEAEKTRAALGAVELTRESVAADHLVLGVPGYPFVVVRAGPYLESADALGSPAFGEGEIAAAHERARLAADEELIRIHGIGFERAAGDPAPGAAPPRVDTEAGGTASTSGGCLSFAPDAFAPGGWVRALELTVPPGGVLVTGEGGPARVKLRRFAETFPTDPHGTLAPGAPAALRIDEDRASAPWHLRLEPQGRLRVCGLS
jgi:hypothetical protein